MRIGVSPPPLIAGSRVLLLWVGFRWSKNGQERKFGAESARRKTILSSAALTFALTGAPLLRVHVERVVRLILPVHLEPGLEAAAGLPVAAFVARS